MVGALGHQWVRGVTGGRISGEVGELPVGEVRRLGGGLADLGVAGEHGHCARHRRTHLWRGLRAEQCNSDQSEGFLLVEAFE